MSVALWAHESARSILRDGREYLRVTNLECLAALGVILAVLVAIVYAVHWAFIRGLDRDGIPVRTSRRAPVKRRVIREIATAGLRGHVRQWTDRSRRVTELVAELPPASRWSVN